MNIYVFDDYSMESVIQLFDDSLNGYRERMWEQRGDYVKAYKYVGYLCIIFYFGLEPSSWERAIMISFTEQEEKEFLRTMGLSEPISDLFCGSPVEEYRTIILEYFQNILKRWTKLKSFW